ncbi:MAG: hypothetical protein K2Z80_24610 [Xanthobacteraceae bacterium]|nr:hypothetical protein [Xanthobacteraceae bacterium]
MTSLTSQFQIAVLALRHALNTNPIFKETDFAPPISIAGIGAFSSGNA